jgi:hypothetical protein
MKATEQKIKNSKKCQRLKKLSMGVSVCLNILSIESLGLHTVLMTFSAVEKFLTFLKSFSQQSINVDQDQDF